VFHQYGEASETATWERYITELEALPPDIVVLGISDYFTLEGYKRLQEARSRGRLENIALLLPVIELRLDKFAGSRTLQKVNLHVVFSDKLSASTIEGWFLNRLAISRQLLAGQEPYRGGLANRADLELFGQAILDATPAEQLTGDSALRVGFANATVDPVQVGSLLENSVFQGKYLTALGVSEWSQMRWEGGGVADKRDVIERADFVLTAAATPSAFESRRLMLRDAHVNARLLDASDAHYYADSREHNRLGECMTWIKASPSFDGLRRAVHCYDRRVRVGEAPHKLRRVVQQPSSFIASVSIRRKPDAALEEKWFDFELPLNSDLVAIIGNQGGGKSALTDSIAHAANVHPRDFSFLTKEKFCDRSGKAAAFEVRLNWRDGTTSVRDLADIHGPTKGSPRVQYVPQGFFDRVTNETNVLEDGKFYGEIKKAVFSHVPETERLGSATLDEWVGKHSAALNERIIAQRGDLAAINREIVALEALRRPVEMRRLEQELELARSLVASHDQVRPTPVPEPAPTEETEKIKLLHEREEELRVQISALGRERAKNVERSVALGNFAIELRSAADAAEKAAKRVALAMSQHDVEVDAKELLSVKLDVSRLDQALAELRSRLAQIDAELEGGLSLTAEADRARDERLALESALESHSRAYADYRTREIEWSERRSQLVGDGDSPAVGSVRELERQLTRLAQEAPSELAALYEKRRTQSRAVLLSIGELRDIFRRATRPVQEMIVSEELLRTRYRIEFDVHLQCIGLSAKFFEFVKHTGSFAGEEEGIELLNAIVACRDMDHEQDALTMVEDVIDHLQWNRTKQDPKPCDPFTLLKARRDLGELYDFLFGFSYLEPAFSLNLNGKPLRQLSPGERGVLLLIFYLVIDKGDGPLVIDQPEGNLNNQSIYEHLVPVFDAAKERRQVIIVTHNPNLAVVCDAEQIVHCSIDAADGNRVCYSAGPLEDPQFNELSLNVLEGTRGAFRARHATYTDGGAL